MNGFELVLVDFFIAAQAFVLSIPERWTSYTISHILWKQTQTMPYLFDQGMMTDIVKQVESEFCKHFRVVGSKFFHVERETF